MQIIAGYLWQLVCLCDLSITFKTLVGKPPVASSKRTGFQRVRRVLDQNYLCKRVVPLCLAVLVLTCSVGCPAVSNLPAPGRLLSQRDPEFDRAYYLYVPTRYKDSQRMPLVVTCHGTNPFDTAKRQLDEWKGLAEQQGFLLAAPKLVGTSGVTAKVEEQIRRQMEDERAILSIIRDIRAARSVDENRIFLTGWSAGGYAVLFTGLRHPEIFRALSVRQGNFNSAFVEPCVPFLDRYQPVQIMFGDIDPLKADAEAGIEWLGGHDIQCTVLERPGTHKRDPVPVFDFFVDCVRRRPWIRIRVQDDPTDPMRVRFSVKASFKPSRILWDFGDKQRSTEARPEHRYDESGVYDVKAALWKSKDKHYVRQIKLQVPRVRLGATLPAD